MLLAAAVLTGSAGNALLLGAAVCVIGVYAIAYELWHDRRVATVGAALMVASPILAIQGGAYLSYLFTLGLGLLFGALLLSGTRLGSTPRVVVAGLLLGWIFMTRPYDAVLWGTAFAGYAAIRDRHRLRDLLRPFLVCGAALLPLVVATLVYNRYVTGKLLEFPITAADPLDSFGFGRKRLMPTFGTVDYGLGKAVRGTAKNAFVLPWFLVGSYVGLLAALVGLWQRREEGTTLALLLMTLVFPARLLRVLGQLPVLPRVTDQRTHLLRAPLRTDLPADRHRPGALVGGPAPAGPRPARPSRRRHRARGHQPLRGEPRHQRPPGAVAHERRRHRGPGAGLRVGHVALPALPEPVRLQRPGAGRPDRCTRPTPATGCST